jgi:hypothetical protein
VELQIKNRRAQGNKVHKKEGPRAQRTSGQGAADCGEYRQAAGVSFVSRSWATVAINMERAFAPFLTGAAPVEADTDYFGRRQFR